MLRGVKGSVPATPAPGKMQMFPSSDRRWKSIDDNGQVSVLNAASPNALVNGGYPFAQRQAPATLTTYSSQTARLFAADRWGIVCENASMQYQRVDTAGALEAGLTSRYYGKYKKITTAGKMVECQVIEGDITAGYHGHKVRVQKLMKCTVATSMTVRLGLAQLTAAGTLDSIPGTFMSAFGAVGTDPTLGTNLAYITPDANSQDGGVITGSALTCSLGTSWLRYSAVFTVPTDCKNLVVVVWTNGQPAALDELNVSEAGFYEGVDIQDWVAPKLSDELIRCQRYYCKTFNVDTNPAQNAGALTGEVRVPSPVTASTAFPVAWTWEFPQTMRAAPTLTLLNPAAANAQIRNQTLNTDCTLSTATANGERRCLLSGTTPASTVVGTNILGVHVTANSEL